MLLVYAVVIGLIAAFLLLLFFPDARHYLNPKRVVNRAVKDPNRLITINVLFWLVLFGLLAAIVAAYL